MHCHAGCTFEAIMAALHLDRPPRVINGRRSTRPALGDPIAVYDYGTYEVCRFAPKTFRQRRPDGQGGYTWSLKGIAPRLYHQDTLRGRVVIAEGEKDVDRRALLPVDTWPRATPGALASGNATHTAGPRRGWRERMSPWYSRTPTIARPGSTPRPSPHACHAVWDRREGRSRSRTPHKDVSAYLDAGGDLKALAAACRAAAQWEPTRCGRTGTGGGAVDVQAQGRSGARSRARHSWS